MNALALVDTQTPTLETVTRKTCIASFTNIKSKSFTEKSKIINHYTLGLQFVKGKNILKVFKY